MPFAAAGSVACRKTGTSDGTAWIVTKNGMAMFQMLLARRGVALVRLRWE